MPAKPPSPSPTPSASSRHSTGPCSPGRAWNGSWASRGPGGDVDADLRAELTGNQRTLPKPQFLRQLPKHRARAAFRGEGERRARLVAELRKARVTGITGDASRRDPRREVGELARGGVGFSGPDRGAVQRGEGGGGTALRAGLCARERLRAVRGARRRGSRRWGEVSECRRPRSRWSSQTGKPTSFCRR